MRSSRLLLFFAAVLAVGCGAPTGPKPLLVSAAADLQDAFKELGPRFEKKTGTPVQFNFAASGMLAQQIRSGAKVDVFASANVEFVNDLEKAGLILGDTKHVYARGRLVAWCREDAKAFPKSLEDLARPEFKRIAIANPVTAPYGIAASQALESAGVWQAIQGRLVYGENIRQTFEFAKSGNADVALASLSLTQGVPGRSFVVPADMHKPINQAIAILKGAPNEPAAGRFVEMIRSQEGGDLLKKFGFELPGAASNGAK